MNSHVEIFSQHGIEPTSLILLTQPLPIELSGRVPPQARFVAIFLELTTVKKQVYFQRSFKILNLKIQLTRIFKYIPRNSLGNIISDELVSGSHIGPTLFCVY